MKPKGAAEPSAGDRRVAPASGPGGPGRGGDPLGGRTLPFDNGAQAWRGAEATIRRDTWLGRAAAIKDREVKAYRHPALDARLRSERTRDEANLLAAARRAGVHVPVLLDVDRAASRIAMELVEGPTLREALAQDDDPAAFTRMAALGEEVGRLHTAGLCHGDLTTSNVLVAVEASSPPVLIDFGLGSFSPDAEPHGVDLHLIEEALEATDARARELFAAFLEGYRQTNAKSDAALARLHDIRERGRYR